MNVEILFFRGIMKKEQMLRNTKKKRTKWI
jgi:hypothetical protein